MIKSWFDKKVVFTIFLSLLFFCQAVIVALAAEPEPGVAILRIERPDILQLPDRFRTSNDEFRIKSKDGKFPSRKGMDTLYVSGSSVFSELEFAKMLTKLPTEHLTIVDLRLESHGYLDGMEVGWYGAYNRANVGLSSNEVEALEQNLLNQTLNGPTAVHKLNNDKSIASTIEVNVTHALTEKELVNLFGIQYHRIQCPDYVKPNDENVDEFLDFYKTLPKDAWLHFHCHAGQGRTTVFIAMVDMLKNAKYVSYEDIMKRQYLIGGQNIRIATSSDAWKKKVYAERAQFTKDFYDYVIQNPDLSIKWSDWVQQHRK